MENTFWLKQTKEKPLFPDLLWSKPENKLAAGKLLVVGGSSHGFPSVAEAYKEAETAGIGNAKVFLPEAIRQSVKLFLDNCEFGASTPSGSFARSSLAQLVDLTDWADGVLLAGEFGRNSETAVMLEAYLTKTKKPVVITKDAIDYFYNLPKTLLDKPNVTVVGSLSQLQKLVSKANFPKPIALAMDLLKLIDTLHEFTQKYPCHLVTNHLNNLIVAGGGKVSTTQITSERDLWQTTAAAHAAVWWLQNPTKAFEALNSALVKS